jgi:hypothetical protein
MDYDEDEALWECFLDSGWYPEDESKVEETFQRYKEYKLHKDEMSVPTSWEP